MEALAGTKGERAKAILKAGCDLVLECSGKINDMVEVASAIPLMNEKTFERLEQGEILRQKSIRVSDSPPGDLLKELNRIFEKYPISEI